MSDTFQQQREAQERIDYRRTWEDDEPEYEQVKACVLPVCLQGRDTKQVVEPYECHLCREGREVARETFKRKFVEVS